MSVAGPTLDKSIRLCLRRTSWTDDPSARPSAFWVDDYDREHSDDGVSRYVHYVNQDPPFEPWTDNDQDVELAVRRPFLRPTWPPSGRKPAGRLPSTSATTG